MTIKAYSVDLVKPIAYVLIIIGLIIAPLSLASKVLLVIGTLIHSCSVTFTFREK